MDEGKNAARETTVTTIPEMDGTLWPRRCFTLRPTHSKRRNEWGTHACSLEPIIATGCDCGHTVNVIDQPIPRSRTARDLGHPPGKGFLRPYIGQISGAFPNVNYSFQGVVDIIGGGPPPGFPANSNVQTDLMQLNPGKLILELPGAPQDFKTTGVTITAPSAVGCPAGTVQVQ